MRLPRNILKIDMGAIGFRIRGQSAGEFCQGFRLNHVIRIHREKQLAAGMGDSRVPCGGRTSVPIVPHYPETGIAASARKV